MTPRFVAFAALMACAAAAHADVINTSTPSTSGFLSGWTTSNGADVIGSGVLAGNVSLVGGIAYGSGSGSAGAQGSNLTDVLLGKASSSLGSAAGSTQLYYTNGIDGMYLLGKGHGILAAMLGNGVAVLGSNDGVLVGQVSASAQTAATGASGGGGMSGGSGSGGAGSTASSGSTGGGTTGSTGASTGGSTGTPAGGSLDLSAGGVTGGTGTGTDTGSGPDGAGSPDLQGDQVFQPPLKAAPAATAAVPEPSTIALMLAGMLGAGVLKRRRAR